jgi:hypothetical protein
MGKYKSDVDAVIAALRAVLNEAEAHKSRAHWKPKIFNRWIGQLPGAWRGRWRRLKLRGIRVERDAFLGHVRATLAYLETQRETLKKERPWWRFLGAPKRPVVRAEHAATRIAPSHPEPQQADEDEETQPRPKWLN